MWGGVLKRNILLIIISIFLFSLTGCTYSYDELREMKIHEKQGKANALNYIKEKYGFDAKVVEVDCDKVASFVFDFTPISTGEVFVTMEHEGKNFYVFISGEEETTDGTDNYQYEEISAALQQKLYDITGLQIEELRLRYGKLHSMKNNRNGLINTYFNGENLSEVMEESYTDVVVSYINQDIAMIDSTKVIEQTGISSYLFVDYDSKEHYDTIANPWYNIAGSPIENGIGENMLYINGYLNATGIDDTYRECKKTIIDDIILITEYPEEEVFIEKTRGMCDASNWNGRGLMNARQIFDSYALETNSKQVEIYIPVDKLATEDLEQVEIAEQYYYNGSMKWHVASSGFTDDGKYVHGTVYPQDYTEFKFTVLKDEE